MKLPHTLRACNACKYKRFLGAHGKHPTSNSCVKHDNFITWLEARCVAQQIFRKQMFPETSESREPSRFHLTDEFCASVANCNSCKDTMQLIYDD